MINICKLSYRVILAVIVSAIVLSILIPSVALAAPPEKDTFFICPSVSLNNEHGMWVLGGHGAYHVLVPTKGGKNEGSKIFVTVPVHVPEQAQVNEKVGRALFRNYPSYPDFYGEDMIMLLDEGLAWLPGAPPTWGEGDILTVMDNGDGTFTVHNMGPMMAPVDKGMLVIANPIPIYAAAIW